MRVQKPGYDDLTQLVVVVSYWLSSETKFIDLSGGFCCWSWIPVKVAAHYDRLSVGNPMEESGVRTQHGVEYGYLRCS